MKKFLSLGLAVFGMAVCLQSSAFATPGTAGPLPGAPAAFTNKNSNDAGNVYQHSSVVPNLPPASLSAISPSTAANTPILMYGSPALVGAIEVSSGVALTGCVFLDSASTSGFTTVALATSSYQGKMLGSFAFTNPIVGASAASPGGFFPLRDHGSPAQAQYGVVGICNGGNNAIAHLRRRDGTQ